MPTDTVRGLPDTAKFALRGVAWSLGLFGLLRLHWTEAHVLLPFTRMQAAAAVGLFGVSGLPVDVTLACSGADALALCLGAILAYPTAWRTRVIGAGGGVAWIVGLNTLRIGTLGRVTASPAWFHALHVYLWPAALTLAIAGYVFAWMRRSDGQARAETRVDRVPIERPRATRQFIVLAAVFLVSFSAASPLYLDSRTVLALAAFVARAAAATLGLLGLGTYAAGNVLWTSRGAFLVTQECISSPLIPVYLAAVCAYSTTWRRLVVGMLVALPLFLVLGIVRLFVVALPASVVVSPLFLVHAFYQLLIGVVVVCLAALWRHGGRSGVRYALVGIAVGALFARLLGPFLIRAVAYSGGALPGDPQGAIAFLPAFQIGLYLALWIAAFIAAGWRRFLAGLVVLEITQAAGMATLHALAVDAGLTAHVRDVRGWAVVGPLVIVAAVINVGRTHR